MQGQRAAVLRQAGQVLRVGYAGCLAACRYRDVGARAYYFSGPGTASHRYRMTGRRVGFNDRARAAFSLALVPTCGLSCGRWSTTSRSFWKRVTGSRYLSCGRWDARAAFRNLNTVLTQYYVRSLLEPRTASVAADLTYA